LLNVSNGCTTDSLETNSASMVGTTTPFPISKFGDCDILILILKVVKIRAIASTLLPRDEERIIGSDIAQ
jgi:hypothetical protein